MPEWTPDLIALITALAALLAILEMRWQRLENYKPVLRVLSSGFVIKSVGSDIYQMLPLNHDSHRGSEASSDEPELSSLHFLA